MSQMLFPCVVLSAPRDAARFRIMSFAQRGSRWRQHTNLHQDHTPNSVSELQLFREAEKWAGSPARDSDEHTPVPRPRSSASSKILLLGT